MTTYSKCRTFSFAAAALAAFPLLCEAGPVGNDGSRLGAGPDAEANRANDPGCVEVTDRPFADFLDAQGTLDDPLLFFPPVKNYVGWTDKKPRVFALVDYAGLADRYLRTEKGISLGTNVFGYVRECHGAGDTALVTVGIFTTRALGFAQTVQALADNAFDFGSTPTFFGIKAQEISAPADAAVGPAALTVSFAIETPGGPLPDLVDVLVQNTPAYAPVSFTFSSSSFGECTGAPGRSARLDVLQTGRSNKKGVMTFQTEEVQVVEAGGGNCRD